MFDNLQELHLKILQNERLNANKQTAKKLSEEFNNLFKNQDFMKKVAQQLNNRYKKEGLDKIATITDKLGMSLTDTVQKDYISNQDTTQKTNEITNVISTIVSDMENNSSTETGIKVSMNQIQGALNKYRGEIGEIFVQKVLNKIVQTGQQLVVNATNEVVDTAKQNLQPKNSSQKNNGITNKRAGDKHRHISVIIGDTELKIHSQQKSDVIQYYNFGKSNQTGIGLSVKNYSNLRDISLVGEGSPYIYGIYGIPINDYIQQIKFAQYLIEKIPNLNPNLLALYGAQSLMGVFQNTEDNTAEILSEYLVVIIRRSTRNPIRILPTGALVHSAFQDVSKINRYFDFSFEIETNNTINAIKNIEINNNNINYFKSIFDAKEVDTAIKMSVKLLRSHLYVSNLKKYYTT